jgi:hypothetical protein
LTRPGQAVDILVLPIVFILLAFTVNLLAILLRVSCHFCGVEIPTYGRALFTVVATIGFGLAAVLGLQASFVGWDPLKVSMTFQLLLVALDLVIFAVVTIAIYAPLLRVRVKQAFNVWLMQAVVFVCFGGLFAGCFGALSFL